MHYRQVSSDCPNLNPGGNKCITLIQNISRRPRVNGLSNRPQKLAEPHYVKRGGSSARKPLALDWQTRPLWAPSTELDRGRGADDNSLRGHLVIISAGGNGCLAHFYQS